MIPNVLVVLVMIVAGAVLIRRTLRSRLAGAGAGFLVTVSLLLLGLYLVGDRLTGAGLNQAFLFHLGTGLNGATIDGYGALVGLAAGGVIMALLAGVVVARTSEMRAEGPRHGFRIAAGFGTLLVAIPFNPAVRDLAVLARTDLAAQTPGRIETPQTYAKVDRLVFPGTRRNLVYLFLESVERSYLDQDRFPGLAPNLSRLEQEAISFTDIREPALASWTVAGMAASLCGTPLFGGAGNSMSRIDAFMPGATCLGELLAQEGYQTDFLGGASLDFAGKGLFLRDHGFGRVEGRDELTPTLAPGAPLSSWGVYDDTIFSIAAERFDALTAASDPFALVLLTLDTHHPAGYPSPSCDGIIYGDGSDPMLNTVHCADMLAGAFIDRIRASPAFKDTVLVVASDHLAMPNTAWDRLEQGERRNLLMAFGADIQPRRDLTPGSTLDIAPTTATLIGAPTVALGFGRSLLGGTPTLTESHAPLEDHLAEQHRFLASLWSFPELSQGITVNMTTQSLQLGASTIGYPALVLLTPALGVEEIQFQTYDEDEPLDRRVEELNGDVPFVWVDRCGAMAVIVAIEGTGEGDLCAVWGALGARQLHGQRLVDESRITFDRLSDDLAMLDTTAARADARRRDWRRGRLIGKDKILSIGAARQFAGHVLLRSAGFGTGLSHVTDIDTEARVDLARGITVLGLRPGAVPVTLWHLDTCADDAIAVAAAAPYRTIAEVFRAHAGFFGGYAVVVHDSAVCDAPVDLHMLFAHTAFTAWPAIAFRTPYVGLVDAGGKVHEFSGPPETSLTIEARDLVASAAAATQQPQAELPRIARAGGALGDRILTNALEALSANHQAYALLQLDLSWTSDGALVCGEGWEDRSISAGTGAPMSLADFQTYAAELPFPPCTLDSLAAWLRQTPEVRIVTGTSADTPEALKMIAARHPDLTARIVPQIYQPSEYPLARALGFPDVIWTLDRFDGDDKTVLRWLHLMDLYGLMMPEAAARRGLARAAFDATGVRSWVHTVNDPDRIDDLRSLGVSEIMTDHLAPPHRE